MERPRRQGRRKLAVAILLVSLAASACGSRLPDEVLARVDAGAGPGAGSGTGVEGGDVGAGTDAAGGPAAAGPEASGSAAPVAGGTATTAPSSSAKASTATTVTANKPGTAAAPVGGQSASTCTPGTATDKGVTPKELKFAAIVTASGPLPGATEGTYRGAAAYFAMINSQGGVCGRKLTLMKGDDGLDSSRARSEFSRLEPQVFGFCCGTAVADSGYIDLLKSTGVPYVGGTVDAAGRELKNVVPKTPDGVISTAPFAYVAKTYPVKKVGYLVSDVASVVALSPPTEAAIQKSGFEIVYNSRAKVTDPDYTSHVIRMRQAGAEFLYLFAFEINMQVRLGRNMRQQNWDPPIKVNSIGYNTKWYDTMGAEGDGWKTFTTFLPMLNADEQAKAPDVIGPFKEWNQRLFPKDQLDNFPVTGWASAAYLVAALRRMGPDATRAKLMEALYAVPEINSGGFGPPRHPITSDTSLCFIAVKAEGGAWHREHPASGFECNMGERYKYK